jgi:hypothetical protein
MGDFEGYVVTEGSSPTRRTQKDLCDIQKKKWGISLKNTSTYLDIYRKQITCGGLFPYPMFECVMICGNSGMPRDQIMLTEKGMPMNFHVLYAEAEILKMMLKQ